MYIWTTEQQILNLDNYKRIDVVYERQDRYWLSAHDTPKTTSKDVFGILIASFDNRTDAMFARCLLFKGLMDRAGAWDASSIPLLSDIWEIWETQKKHFSSQRHIRMEFLEHLEISVTGLDEVTLIYSSKWERELGSVIEDYKKQVGTQLQDKLSMDVKWKVSDS